MRLVRLCTVTGWSEGVGVGGVWGWRDWYWVGARRIGAVTGKGSIALSVWFGFSWGSVRFVCGCMLGWWWWFIVVDSYELVIVCDCWFIAVFWCDVRWVCCVGWFSVTFVLKAKSLLLVYF